MRTTNGPVFVLIIQLTSKIAFNLILRYSALDIEGLMKAFVTGGSGFIGRHIIRKLVDRGYEVSALVRSPEGAASLAPLGVHIVLGDVIDSASMREAMRGSDVVYHVAGHVKTGDPDSERLSPNGWRGVRTLGLL